MLDEIQTEAMGLFTIVEGQMWDNLRISIDAVPDEETRNVLVAWAGNMMQDALNAAVKHNDQQSVLQAHIVAYGIASIFRLALHRWYVEDVNADGKPRQYEREQADESDG